MTKNNEKKQEKGVPNSNVKPVSNPASLAIRDKDISEYLLSYQNSILKFAVRDYNHNDFMKTAMLCISESVNLQKCLKSDVGRNSLYHALKLGATTGLSLNPQEGKSCLIAYEDKNGKMIVNYQIMKNGMLQLLKETGQIKFITSDLVRENDSFRITKSMDGDSYQFEPTLTNRGNCFGYFAACKLIDGTTHVVYMSEEEIIDHYHRYAASKKDGAAWNKSPEGMAIKTVLKKLARNLVLSDETSAGIGADDFSESQDTEPVNVTSVAVEKASDVF